MTDLDAAPSLGLTLRSKAVRATLDALRDGDTVDATETTWRVAETVEGMLDDPDPDREAELVWLLIANLDAVVAAATRVKAAAERLLAANVAAGGAVRFGDSVYRAAPRTVDRIDDVDGLLDWLDAVGGGAAIRKVFRHGPDTLRKTALDDEVARYLADGGEVTDEHRSQARRLFDTWGIGKVPHGDGGVRLESVPANRAKWSDALAHGDRDVSRSLAAHRDVRGYVAAYGEQGGDPVMVVDGGPPWILDALDILGIEYIDARSVEPAGPVDEPDTAE